ncbi:MAG: methionine adenosyltransferase [Sphaerochaeta sp.]|jgi:S-adenosylmethionine synthetase
MRSSLFTSESVSEGHPDKVCDQISDAILDACLAKDPASRVACEVFATTDHLIIGGEITTRATIDVEAIARQVIADIGYDRPEEGFAHQTVKVTDLITAQSADISMGVDEETARFGEQGAGDQGMMFGYACSETPSLMPAPIMWAHRLLERADSLRKRGASMLRPDAKSQVTVRYEGGVPIHIDTVVISHQHEEAITHAQLEEFLRDEVITPTLSATGLLDEKTKIYINPTGRFVIGGPAGDTGLTGRKIIVDTYGGMGRHGGGAFSGKDPSKVDRSAAYMARHVAKSLVANGLCSRCEVQLSYAIGIPFPISVLVDTFGTATVDEASLEKLVEKSFDLTPSGIIKSLDLKNPIYQENVNYGHFGRGGVTWEETKPL